MFVCTGRGVGVTAAATDLGALYGPMITAQAFQAANRYSADLGKGLRRSASFQVDGAGEGTGTQPKAQDPGDIPTRPCGLVCALGCVC